MKQISVMNVKKIINFLLSFLNIKIIKTNSDIFTIDGVYKFYYGSQPKSISVIKKEKFRNITSKITVFDIGANFLRYVSNK